MATGEIIGVGRTERGLPVPDRRRVPTVRGTPPLRLTEVVAMLDRAPLEAALGAYAEGERRDLRRIPAGFFRSRTV